MKIEIDHAPGELAARLADALHEIIDAAMADAAHAHEHMGALEKASRSHVEAAEDFRFEAPRRMYLRAMALVPVRRAVMQAAVKRALAGNT